MIGWCETNERVDLCICRTKHSKKINTLLVLPAGERLELLNLERSLVRIKA